MISLQGGLEDVDEFLRSLSISASNSALRFSNPTMRSSSRRMVSMSSAFVHASSPFMPTVIGRPHSLLPGVFDRKPMSSYEWGLTSEICIVSFQRAK